MSVAEELAKRRSIWDQLRRQNVDDVEPSVLRHLGVYGGAQGIWVDKGRTAGAVWRRPGRHGRYPPYRPSLFGRSLEDGVIYHYPKTKRPPARDLAEVQATKNAGSLNLPIFIIAPGKSSPSRRAVRLGWVEDHSDASRQFLILFGQDKPAYEPPLPVDAPFELVDYTPLGIALTKVRKGQQRFRFHVIARLGCKCAVCQISHPSLIKAGHIRGKAHKGSDDWRNGLALCATHHDAFDAHLFAITRSPSPSSLPQGRPLKA